ILTESEKRYKELFTSNPNPMWVYDLETLSFLDVNEAAIYNYGYSREEFLSMTLKDIRPQEEVSKLLENIKTAHYGLEYSSGWQHLKKDGSIIDVEIRSNALDHQGRKAKLVSALDVTWRKKSEEEIKKSREELRALTFHLQSIREEERAAISRELHDELGQLLTSIKMNLVMMGKELTVQFKNSDTEYFEKEIGAMSELLDISVKRVRKIITELRPEVLLNLELYDAIDWQIKEFSGRSGIKCKLNYNCKKHNFDSDLNITIFRIIQEALTNVMRHSGADNVEVKISCENERVILSVADNGKGIKNLENIPGKSFGILGIRERAILLGGNMDIKSYPGKGTELLVSIPLKKS
ncbi:MAG: PAS domain-containing sensor histidine kinase, partial [Ignavibacteriaceae bacterium]|nr:PAS domain-containing sensor histidine kinase [Ignavibacteriaceae bacterium]